MFRQFFLRCYRSFSRNFVVSILPLVMPMVFLLLFLDATQGAAEAPALRVAVTSEAASSAWVDTLIATGVVKIDPLPSGADPDVIDVRKQDAILTLSSTEEGAVELRVRKGFEPWAKLLSQQASLAATGVAGVTGENGEKTFTTPEPVHGQLRIRELETRRNDYLSFILPGLFVMVLIQLAMTSTANVVLNDRADGTFRMIASVKGALLPLISAEILFRLLFACLCYAMMIVAINQATDGWIGPNIVPFTGVFLLGAAMMVALGYTLGGLLPGRRNWSAVITVLGLAFWFFSDILFQASQHPLARPVSLMLPPTYLTDALRQVATGRPGTFPLYIDIGAMLMVLIGSAIVSIKYFRFETNDDRM